ncbi:MAG: hypothetical protein WBW33_26135 [Bryobacteraceae bacterium]
MPQALEHARPGLAAPGFAASVEAETDVVGNADPISSKAANNPTSPRACAGIGTGTEAIPGGHEQVDSVEWPVVQLSAEVQRESDAPVGDSGFEQRDTQRTGFSTTEQGLAAEIVHREPDGTGSRDGLRNRVQRKPGADQLVPGEKTETQQIEAAPTGNSEAAEIVHRDEGDALMTSQKKVLREPGGESERVRSEQAGIQGVAATRIGNSVSVETIHREPDGAGSSDDLRNRVQRKPGPDQPVIGNSEAANTVYRDAGDALVTSQEKVVREPGGESERVGSEQAGIQAIAVTRIGNSVSVNTVHREPGGAGSSDELRNRVQRKPGAGQLVLGAKTETQQTETSLIGNSEAAEIVHRDGTDTPVTPQEKVLRDPGGAGEEITNAKTRTHGIAAARIGDSTVVGSVHRQPTVAGSSDESRERVERKQRARDQLVLGEETGPQRIEAVRSGNLEAPQIVHRSAVGEVSSAGSHGIAPVDEGLPERMQRQRDRANSPEPGEKTETQWIDVTPIGNSATQIVHRDGAEATAGEHDDPLVTSRVADKTGPHQSAVTLVNQDKSELKSAISPREADGGPSPVAAASRRFLPYVVSRSEPPVSSAVVHREAHSAVTDEHPATTSVSRTVTSQIVQRQASGWDPSTKKETWESQFQQAATQSRFMASAGPPETSPRTTAEPRKSFKAFEGPMLPAMVHRQTDSQGGNEIASGTGGPVPGAFSDESGTERPLQSRNIDQSRFAEQTEYGLTDVPIPPNMVYHYGSSAMMNRTDAEEALRRGEGGQEAGKEWRVFDRDPAGGTGQTPVPSAASPLITQRAENPKPLGVDTLDRVLTVPVTRALQRYNAGDVRAGNGPESAGNQFVDRFVFRQAGGGSAASSGTLARTTAPGSIPATIPMFTGATRSSSTASAPAMTDVEIRRLADRVYQMLVRRLASEKERRGLSDGV